MSGFANPETPSLADFGVFLANSVGIPASALPPASPWPGYAYNQAIARVLNVPGVPGIEYSLAVYNCATHLLIKIAPDQPGQTFFQDSRAPTPSGFGLASPSMGMLASSADEGTSNAFAVPDYAKGLTVGDLEFLKTPWGRDYLAYQQNFGTVWGLT